MRGMRRKVDDTKGGVGCGRAPWHEFQMSWSALESGKNKGLEASGKIKEEISPVPMPKERRVKGKKGGGGT